MIYQQLHFAKCGAIDLRVRPQRILPHPAPSTVTRQAAQRDSSRKALRSLVDFCQDEILKYLRPCLPRKEVIQPHLPIRLPCYDFVPITNHTFGTCFLAVSPATSGATSFRDVTGGVYKARERIHRSVADLRLLVIPASCRRVAACNPN